MYNEHDIHFLRSFEFTLLELRTEYFWNIQIVYSDA